MRGNGYQKQIDNVVGTMAKNKKEYISNTLEELIGKGNLEIIKQSFATDYIVHAGSKEYKGHSFLKRFTGQLRSAIPDVRIVNVKFLAEDKATIVWQRRLKGTHKVEMKGIPASGKKVEWVDMVVSRFNADKITEEWVVSELMGELLLKVSRE